MLAAIVTDTDYDVAVVISIVKALDVGVVACCLTTCTVTRHSIIHLQWSLWVMEKYLYSYFSTM